LPGMSREPDSYEIETMAKKWRTWQNVWLVPIRSCSISFRGVSGVRHSVELDAESVYDAAIRGMALLRRDGWVDNVGPATELEVEVREPATRHTVSVEQLRRWCDGIAASPAEAIRKAKLKQLLGG
jgi:hypothetical protein